MDYLRPILVKDNVYIGLGATIMPGVTIGNNCIIGAKSVVTHNIPNGSVAVGSPAKVIKNIDDYYKGLIQKGYLYPTVGMNHKDKRKYLDIILNK